MPWLYSEGTTAQTSGTSKETTALSSKKTDTKTSRAARYPPHRGRCDVTKHARRPDAGCSVCRRRAKTVRHGSYTRPTTSTITAGHRRSQKSPPRTTAAVGKTSDTEERIAGQIRPAQYLLFRLLHVTREPDADGLRV